jgi:hypothetical protein
MYQVWSWILTKLGTSLGESGILFIFKVKGQCHQVRFLLHNILQWILTKLGTYLALKRIWNPIERYYIPSQLRWQGDKKQFK